MKIFRKVNPFNLFKTVPRKNQARFLLNAHLQAGGSMPDIRSSLISFYKINLSNLVNGHPISVESLYAAKRGERFNPLAMELIARALKLKVPELFPDAESLKH